VEASKSAMILFKSMTRVFLFQVFELAEEIKLVDVKFVDGGEVDIDGVTCIDWVGVDIDGVTTIELERDIIGDNVGELRGDVIGDGCEIEALLLWRGERGEGSRE
jgi:hypothetical protein